MEDAVKPLHSGQADRDDQPHEAASPSVTRCELVPYGNRLNGKRRRRYPVYRNNNWQIGTGMIESTARQLVAVRLKGPGMHWSKPGASAVTALKAHHINHGWHQLWTNLVIP